MTNQQQGDFCYGFAAGDEGAVAFQCSADKEKWPWLNLHPANNIAVQATNYFSLTGVSQFRGNMDGEKWTALTSFQWRILAMEEGALHPARGLAAPAAAGSEMDYGCAFFDKNDNPVYRVSGTGVVFRNRDFKGWRAKAKKEILRLPEPKGFVFSSPAAAGVATPGECFVSPLSHTGEGVFADALVTEETGFPPAHPYHDGSGDHVNSSHLCDAAQQTAQLIRGEAGLKGYSTGGEVIFSRYVELGRPFRLMLVSSLSALNKLSLRIMQADHLCADLTFFYDD